MLTFNPSYDKYKHSVHFIYMVMFTLCRVYVHLGIKFPKVFINEKEK